MNKRFFPQGVKLETGPHAGAYYYTRDHLGSIRELTDAAGNVRARYSYDSYGRRTKVSGDVDTDFGFAGMFWSSETSLALTHFRAYDPNLGRWLSRDPLKHAEMREGPNLYAYVRNSPVNLIDPSGKGWELVAGRWLFTSAENSGGPLGSSAANLLGNGGTSVEQTAEEELAELAERQLAKLTAAESSSCVFFADVGAVGGATIAVAVVASAAAGSAFGYFVLDKEFHLDAQATDFGLNVQDKTDSRALGALATLEAATNPGFWIGRAIIGN